MTNADGRTDSPILSKEDFALGQYELVFHAGDYLRRTGQAGQAPLFLDVVPIRFGMSQDDHYPCAPSSVGPWFFPPIAEAKEHNNV